MRRSTSQMGQNEIVSAQFGSSGVIPSCGCWPNPQLVECVGRNALLPAFEADDWPSFTSVMFDLRRISRTSGRQIGSIQPSGCSREKCPWKMGLGVRRRTLY